MPDRFPPLAPVRVRAAHASYVGPRRERNDDRLGFFEDPSCALAIVADGIGAEGEKASQCAVDTAGTIFRGRTTVVLDELAETWWTSEHSEQPSGNRVRPFSTLPIRERGELRDRVRVLLERRIPETIGDAAVLESETKSLLGIGTRALERANATVHRTPPNTAQMYAGLGACAAATTFAGGQASIAWAGDCRVLRVRNASIELLTTDHTVQNDLDSLRPEQRTSRDQLETLPRNLLTRLLGPRENVRIGTRSIALEPGDLFLLATRGLWRAFSEMELLTMLQSRGTEAAGYLIERGKRARLEPPDDDLTAVVIEVLGD